MNTYQEFLEKIYNDWWLESLSYYKSGSVITDKHLLNLARDVRKGITLLIKPDRQVTEQVWKVINHLRAVEPDQYFYQKDELHLTALSLFSAREAYEPSIKELKDYQCAVESALLGKKRFSIKFKGVTAARDCVMAQDAGFFGGFEQPSKP